VAAACFCWGLDNHLTALIDGITPAESTFWKGLLAGTVNLGIGIVVEPFNANLWQIGLALVTGVFAYGLSITLYIGAAQALGATRSQLVFSTSPYFGILLSVLLLHESLTLTQVVSAVLVGICVALLTIEWHGHDHDHPAFEHEHWHDHADPHHGHAHSVATESTNHSHRHLHAPLMHTHRHWPDLHHRHEH
jgi:drug/metabolite transporter (DMT)-like permease